MTKALDIQAREAEFVLQTYKRQPVVFVKGAGARLEDIDGTVYLDFISGIGVSVLGHAHPALTAAVADQVAALIHTSNLYYHPLQGQVASRLAALSGLQRSFFCNSGTEAMEACLKFARRYWFTQGVKGRTQLPGMVEDAMRGDIELAPFVTHTMPLDDINEAFELMHAGKSIRSVVHYA